MRTLATLGLVALAIASTGCQSTYSRCRIEANYSSLLWSCCLKVTAENLPATVAWCVTKPTDVHLHFDPFHFEGCESNSGSGGRQD
jgi:hypothetical protein